MSPETPQGYQPNSPNNLRRKIFSLAKRAWEHANNHLDKPAPRMSRRQLLFGSTALGVAAYTEGKFGWIGRATEILGGEEKEPLPAPGQQSDILIESDKFTNYIYRYSDLAVELSSNPDLPLPYELYLAVSMHESDSGTSELAREANNLFGVIAKDGWRGEVYNKPTEEQIPKNELEKYRKSNPDLQVLRDNQNGTLRVKYSRPFRKYKDARESFEDFAEKIYYKESNGKYRYADVIEYIQSGGRDPYNIIDLMSDDDEPGEARYATGDEWRTKVPTYVRLIQKITNKPTVPHPVDTIAPDATLPDEQAKVKVESIAFKKFESAEEKKVRKTMEAGFGNLNKQSYERYIANSIKDKSSETRKAFGEKDYKRFFDDPIKKQDLKHIVLHMWSIAMPNGATVGRSHDISLSTMVESWSNSKKGSTGFLLSDNADGEMWQLSESPFSRTAHVGNGGIHDPEGAKTHPGVRNSNSIGLEVQADTIYDVNSKQFESIVYWATNMLFASGKVSKGMSRDKINKVVDDTVIGHGKNNGLEFGYKYTRPIIQAIQQFVYIAING